MVVYLSLLCFVNSFNKEIIYRILFELKFSSGLIYIGKKNENSSLIEGRFSTICYEAYSVIESNQDKSQNFPKT